MNVLGLRLVGGGVENRLVVGLLDSSLGEVVPEAPVLWQDVVGGDGDDAEDRGNAVVMQNLLGAAHEK
jgi:hypothetical protein